MRSIEAPSKQINVFIIKNWHLFDTVLMRKIMFWCFVFKFEFILSLFIFIYILMLIYKLKCIFGALFDCWSAHGQKLHLFIISNRLKGYLNLTIIRIRTSALVWVLHHEISYLFAFVFIQIYMKWLVFSAGCVWVYVVQLELRNCICLIIRSGFKPFWLGRVSLSKHFVFHIQLFKIWTRHLYFQIIWKL